jgi:hypothetical protein
MSKAIRYAAFILHVVAGVAAGSSAALRAESLPPGEAKLTPPAVSPTSPGIAAALGVTFVEGSNSTVIIKREGRPYLIDLAARTITEVAPTSTAPPAAKALTSSQPPEPKPQDTAATPAPKKDRPKVYEPGDDYVFSLPTGRPLDRHGFYINFNHRFAFEPAFAGKARGATLMGLDSWALPSFGFRYGVTDKFSVGISRSPSYLSRPIELMAGYNFADERDGHPLNGAIRFSVQGQDHFATNFTYSLEGIFSRSLSRRAQLYVVPTVTLQNRRLISHTYANPVPELPGFNSFSLGIGGSLDIRPTVALVAEVIPTLAGGRELGIHRPPYAFGIQKKLFRHAFTFGFTTGPGTTAAQRAGTRATLINREYGDKPSGLFIGFDLTRQVY